MKILTIVGARPQFIKAAPLSIEFQKHTSINEYILHSGQHYDPNMSDIFFDQLKIPRPYQKLDLPGKTQGKLTANILKVTEQAITQIQPDYVVVFGDTNTTLGAAIAAAKLDTILCHVEAGLRSFNMQMPEEINRRLVDHCSDILFAPSETAVSNLAKENITNGKIFNVGDIMYDAVKLWKEAAVKPAAFPDTIGSEKIIFTTLHRRENLHNSNKLNDFVDALLLLSKTNKIIFPVHPHTRMFFAKNGLLKKLDTARISICDPLSYLESLYALNHAHLLITDSGGMQKEAFYCGLHCITYRDETEWPETVSAGANCLTNNAEDLLNAAFDRLLVPLQIPLNSGPYGEGKTAEKIANILVRHYRSNAA